MAQASGFTDRGRLRAFVRGCGAVSDAVALLWLLTTARVVGSTTIDIIRILRVEVVLQNLGLIEVKLFVGLYMR